jgi:hypothetical protein
VVFVFMTVNNSDMPADRSALLLATSIALPLAVSGVMLAISQSPFA